jgi:hypothetical protein
MTLGDAGGRSANRRGRRRQEGGDVRGRPGDAVFTEYRGRPLELDGDRVYQFSLEWRLGQTMDPIIREELIQDGSNLREIGHPSGACSKRLPTCRGDEEPMLDLRDQRVG